MSLYDEIVAVYPELTSEEFHPFDGVIRLRDDSDGQGAYIEKWEYHKPIPAGLTLGKPGGN